MIDTRKLLQITAVFTLISMAVFILMLFRVDPFMGGKSALIYFLASLFLALSGILTFVGYYLRSMFNKDKIHFNNFIVSLRQGVLISTVIVGLLILKSMESLAWWDGLLLVASMVFLELFFRS
jgi:hypothetical protein